MAMEFWGAEIKAGEPLKVQKQEGILLHLSQASLGEVKKGSGNDSVVLSVTIDGKKIVLGTLSSDKFPQIAYDLVFEKDFELSHNWKHGSVYVCGYRAEADEDSEDGMFESEEEEEEEDIPTPLAENGKAEAKADKPKAPVEKAKATKPDSSAAKKNIKPVKPDSDEDDSDEEDDSDDEDDSEEMLMDEDDSSEEDDDEESSEEEDEATPKNAKQNKKRPSESATKTPVPEKKAKLVTPQKSGGEGKKGTAHTATPHPSKAGKGDKKQQTPKSGGSVKCQACSKTFNSDSALQSHTKAKHSEVK